MHDVSFFAMGEYLCRRVATTAPINYSNHWILPQLDQVNKIDPWPGGTKVLFAATSDRLPSHSTKMEEPQTAVSPSLGLISMAYVEEKVRAVHNDNCSST